MAREFIDGFESGASDLWNVLGGSLGTQAAATYGFTTGNYCAYVAASTTAGRTVTARSAYYMAFKIRPATGNSYIQFRNGSTILGLVRCPAGGAPECWRGDTAALLATSGTSIAAGTVVLMEVYYYPKTDTTGRFMLKLNGITVVDYTGNTSASALQMDGLYFFTGSTGAFYVDDVIIDSSSWIGNTVIQGVTVSGAGATTQFTPSTGSNYTCIDEIPYSDTDYIYTNGVNNTDTYAASDLTGDVGSVKCVQVQARANYTGAATPVNLDLVVRSNGTDYPSSDQAVTTSFKTLCALWETNPNTSTAWTSTTVNAVEIGVKSKA